MNEIISQTEEIHWWQKSGSTVTSEETVANEFRASFRNLDYCYEQRLNSIYEKHGPEFLYHHKLQTLLT